MEIDYLAIGQRIEDLRRAKKPKVTREHLAEEVGVTGTTIYRWERAEIKPELVHLAKVADFFKIKLSTLLGETGEQVLNPTLDLDANELPGFSDAGALLVKLAGVSPLRRKYVFALVYGDPALVTGASPRVAQAFLTLLKSL